MSDSNFNAGIMIFNDVQTMDFAAPMEVLFQAKFNVFTVAKSVDPIKTSSGQPLIPNYEFSDHPEIDIMVIPAGRDFDSPADPAETDWMQKTSKTARYILTICCGSIELARAGVLKHGRATTHHGYISELKKYAPEVETVTGKKWVEEGNVITSGGLSSGIDASLYLVSKIKGMEEAERIAKWMEFFWAKN